MTQWVIILEYSVPYGLVQDHFMIPGVQRVYHTMNWLDFRLPHNSTVFIGTNPMDCAIQPISFDGTYPVQPLIY